jgi:spermidine dehydrogenase
MHDEEAMHGDETGAPESHPPIRRRDFVNGVLVAASGALLGAPGRFLAAADGAVNPLPGESTSGYPPLLTGLRGSQPGSEGVPHALRDGAAWPNPIDSGEIYDLIVVGAGISGLAAAHYYRRVIKRNARILLLENSDDFGGHARRNEFWMDGRLHLMNGGSQDLENPRPFGPRLISLLRELGIPADQLPSRADADRVYERMGLHEGIYLDHNTFGTEALIIDRPDWSWTRKLAGVLLPDAVKKDIVELEEGIENPWPGLSDAQKKQRLSRMSYRDFLLSVRQVDARTPAFYDGQTKDLWCTGIDAVSALDAWGVGMPGFQGLKLTPRAIRRMGSTPAGYAECGGSSDTGGQRKVHLPDGNASVARALLRTLIPAAVPGATYDDLISVPVRYAGLDQTDAAVRLRLSSTAVKVMNGNGRGGSVEVTYIRGQDAFKVAARHCVLACYNAIIPYLCPSLPSTQIRALHSTTRAPLVYATVALRSWVPFVRSGVFRVHAPGADFPFLWLNEPTSIGGFRTPEGPEYPILLHMTAMPCAPGRSEMDQHRAGRAELLATSFGAFEQRIGAQLTAIFGASGFDAARDIEAITLNRWPHGYAHEYNPLFDADLPEHERPYVIGRQRHGNIAIANSDAGAAAYMESAVEQAYRAVSELKGI